MKSKKVIKKMFIPLLIILAIFMTCATGFASAMNNNSTNDVLIDTCT